MENWKLLCNAFEPLITRNAPEKELSTAIQTALGWNAKNVRHEVPVRIGKETKFADIVLSTKDGIGIVIELKRPSIDLDNKDVEGQLMGYMRILKHKYGLLVGNKIKIYHDDDENDFSLLATIHFALDDKKGRPFVEVFASDNLTKENLDKFKLEYGDPPKPIKPSELSEPLKGRGFDELRALRQQEIRNHFSGDFTMSVNHNYAGGNLLGNKSFGFFVHLNKNPGTSYIKLYNLAEVTNPAWFKGIMEKVMEDISAKLSDGEKSVLKSFKFDKNRGDTPNYAFWIYFDEELPSVELIDKIVSGAGIEMAR